MKLFVSGVPSRFACRHGCSEEWSATRCVGLRPRAEPGRPGPARAPREYRSSRCSRPAALCPTQSHRRPSSVPPRVTDRHPLSHPESQTAALCPKRVTDGHPLYHPESQAAALCPTQSHRRPPSVPPRVTGRPLSHPELQTALCPTQSRRPSSVPPRVTGRPLSHPEI